MTSFNLDDVSKALDVSQKSEDGPKGISFENKNLKLDTVEDAKLLVDAINKCDCLEYLNLAGNTLGVDASEAVAKSLETHPEFKRALWKDLFTGRLKDEIPKSLKFLGDGLVKANARLTELDLSDNAFGPIGVEGLASLLSSPTCYNLQELRLNNNGLGIGGGRLLATALLDCYNCSKNNGAPLALKVFIAGRNRLENEGAKALANVFQTIGTLEEIAMPQNGIYHVGITALAQSFAQNPQLRILNLNDNTIGPKGSIALAGTLRKLVKLQKINLGDCLLKTKGAISIATALEKLNELQEVLLDYNEIRTDGGEKIAKVLAGKQHLTTLGLDGNAFGSEGIKKVQQALGGVNLKALQSLEGDESADEDEEESDDNGEEVEDEEEEEEEQQQPEINQNGDQLAPETIRSSTVSEFLVCPNGDRLLGLGDCAADLLLQEAQLEGTDDNTEPDQFLNTYVPVLMKVAALAMDPNEKAAQQALDCSDLLFRQLFKWGKGHEQRSALLDNALLVHLGLIKSEERKYRPSWNLAGCMFALDKARSKGYFPKSINDCLTLFIQNKNTTKT